MHLCMLSTLVADQSVLRPSVAPPKATDKIPYTTPSVKTGLFAILTRLFALIDSGVDKCEGADVALQKREILGLDVVEIQYII